MLTEYRWTTADIEVMPEIQGGRYEIIDGELFMSTQPHYHHQLTCSNVTSLLREWSIKTRLGQAVAAPSIIFADDDNVAPDVIWCSNERLKQALREDGKLHLAPELVIEVVSPGSTNELRDRQAKLKLYSRRGVEEYWILDWMFGCAEIYRRKNKQLRLAETLTKQDAVTSPLLPGFACRLADFFEYPPETNGTNGHHQSTKRNGTSRK
jgi:Uma2 family endonuclease